MTRFLLVLEGYRRISHDHRTILKEEAQKFMDHIVWGWVNQRALLL